MRTLVGLLLALLTACSCRGAERRAAFTSTNSITSIAAAPDGSLWVGTRGGVLLRTKNGQWRKFTVLDGLPGNEVLSVSIEDATVHVSCPQASALYTDGRWTAPAQKAPEDRETLVTCPPVTWRGKTCRAWVSGLGIGEGENAASVPLPKSPGTHISALLPKGESLWAAVFGDGIWAYDGKGWSRVKISLPPACKQITAMASIGDIVLIGTRRDGMWEFNGKSWKQHLQPDEPFDHNCQAFAVFKGRLLVSTLEDGLLSYDGRNWWRCIKPEISSNCPRQMVEYRGRLYLRHSDGMIDSFDGERWMLNVCSEVPRKQATAIAADSDHLYIGQWGGWSEFGGEQWVHHLKEAGLQGAPVTALCADAGKLWIGTQGKGLACADRASGKLQWYDERSGMPDDWLRVIAKSGDTVMAGTFIGGLACIRGDRADAARETLGAEVTAMAACGKPAIIATRRGLWSRSAAGVLTKMQAPGDEFQAVCVFQNNLWIGTRTGIYTISLASPDLLQR